MLSILICFSRCSEYLWSTLLLSQQTMGVFPSNEQVWGFFPLWKPLIAEGHFWMAVHFPIVNVLSWKVHGSSSKRKNEIIGGFRERFFRDNNFRTPYHTILYFDSMSVHRKWKVKLKQILKSLNWILPISSNFSLLFRFKQYYFL
jgi:hypothetical protein